MDKKGTIDAANQVVSLKNGQELKLPKKEVSVFQLVGDNVHNVIDIEGGIRGEKKRSFGGGRRRCWMTWLKDQRLETMKTQVLNVFLRHDFYSHKYHTMVTRGQGKQVTNKETITVNELQKNNMGLSQMKYVVINKSLWTQNWVLISPYVSMDLTSWCILFAERKVWVYELVL